MSDTDDIKQGFAELKEEFRHLASGFTDIKVAMARYEERQNDTTKKIDMMTLALSNNYVSAVEFNATKRSMEDRLKTLEQWNTWIIRLVVGGVVLAGLAALRIKGGI